MIVIKTKCKRFVLNGLGTHISRLIEVYSVSLFSINTGVAVHFECISYIMRVHLIIINKPKQHLSVNQDEWENAGERVYHN